MVDSPLRFLHASDLRLECPLAGLSQVPAALRELCRDAPLLAARRLFERAIGEHVDFVILAGDVVDLRSAGPSELSLLVEQFDRLAGEQIGVYWAGGPFDPPEAWPAALRLPANVKVFPRSRADSFTHTRSDGTAIASLTGLSCPTDGRIDPADFWQHPGGLPSIAVAHGEANMVALASRGIHYWALGGRRGAATPLRDGPVANYPGTHQGRTPTETGSHGASLVEFTASLVPRISPLACDVVQWCAVDLQAGPHSNREQLERLLSAEVERLVAAAPSTPLFITWRVRITGGLGTGVHRSRLAADLLTWLRAEFSGRTPTVWSVSLQVEHAVPRSADHRADSVLAHYLGAVEHLAAQGESSTEAVMISPLLEGVRPPAWDAVIREAALLGTDLLTAEEESV